MKKKLFRIKQTVQYDRLAENGQYAYASPEINILKVKLFQKSSFDVEHHD